MSSQLNRILNKKFDNSIQKLMMYTDNYTPMRLGILKNTVDVKKQSDTKVTFEYQGYGKYLYDRPHLNFTGSPQRGARWVHKAFELHKEDILSND